MIPLECNDMHANRCYTLTAAQVIFPCICILYLSPLSWSSTHALSNTSLAPQIDIRNTPQIAVLQCCQANSRAPPQTARMPKSLMRAAGDPKPCNTQLSTAQQTGVVQSYTFTATLNHSSADHIRSDQGSLITLYACPMTHG